MTRDQDPLLEQATRLAVDAGVAILRHYGSAGPVERKADHSPLTLADKAAHEVLARGLPSLLPGVHVLSEESRPDEIADRRSWSRYWLVDPLDGTKEFLKRSGEFTVNVALVEGHEPVLGVVHVPAHRTTWTARRGLGAFVRRGDAPPAPIRCRSVPPDHVAVLGSRDHGLAELEALLARVPGAVRRSAGSALKFGLIAEGQADLYPRLGRTMEWDTAAGQCVVETAGGRVTDLEGRRLAYNKAVLDNPSFLVFGDASVDWPARLR